jgi:hypothetical protein
MKKRLKVLFSVLVTLMLVISSIGSVYAESRNESKSAKNQQKQIKKLLESKFKDINDSFWAFEAIMELTERGIINGYLDKTFKPNEKVTRAQFASMLTKALKLETVNTTQTFTDVPASNWAYKVVEAAKDYLTGYKTSDGKMYFYGEKNSVREDMAVALVKALNLSLEADNGQLQQVFTDYDKISVNLRNHIYTAYKNGIMIGSDGKFSPQKNLTRAEAATLIMRALQKTEKVVIEDDSGEKVIIDNSGKSTDAALSNLAVGGVTVSGFVSSSLEYNIVLPAGTTAVPVVTAAANAAGKASVTVTQAAGLPGSAVIVVTAEDGITKRTYTIYFTVAAAAKNADAALSNLAVDGTTIANFSAGTLTYNVVLPAGTTVIPVAGATVNDIGKASLNITQAAALPGSATVVVTAEDGITKRTYTISFTVSAS